MMKSTDDAGAIVTTNGVQVSHGLLKCIGDAVLPAMLLGVDGTKVSPKTPFFYNCEECMIDTWCKHWD
jgi:hypothetical protein